MKAMAPCVNMLPQAKLYVLTNVSGIARPGIKSALYQFQRHNFTVPKPRHNFTVPKPRSWNSR
jgi:hypothetical protein